MSSTNTHNILWQKAMTEFDLLEPNHSDSPSCFSDQDLSTAPSNSDKPTTLHVHGNKNANERARRNCLNAHLRDLAHCIPALQNVRRPSKILILERAVGFFDQVQRRVNELERENLLLTREIEHLKNAMATSTVMQDDPRVESLPSPPFGEAHSDDYPHSYRAPSPPLGEAHSEEFPQSYLAPSPPLGEAHSEEFPQSYLAPSPPFGEAHSDDYPQSYLAPSPSSGKAQPDNFPQSYLAPSPPFGEAHSDDYPQSYLAPSPPSGEAQPDNFPQSYLAPSPSFGEAQPNEYPQSYLAASSAYTPFSSTCNLYATPSSSSESDFSPPRSLTPTPCVLQEHNELFAESDPIWCQMPFHSVSPDSESFPPLPYQPEMSFPSEEALFNSLKMETIMSMEDMSLSGILDGEMNPHMDPQAISVCGGENSRMIWT